MTVHSFWTLVPLQASKAIYFVNEFPWTGGSHPQLISNRIDALTPQCLVGQEGTWGITEWWNQESPQNTTWFSRKPYSKIYNIIRMLQSESRGEIWKIIRDSCFLYIYLFFRFHMKNIYSIYIVLTGKSSFIVDSNEIRAI